MFNQNTYLGLDINDSSVKVIQFKTTPKKQEVISYGLAALPEGIVQEGEIKKPEDLLAIVKDLFKNTKGGEIKTRYGCCSLPEEKSFVRLVSLPLMGEKELKEAIKWVAETEIPMKLNELYLGWELIEEHLGNDDEEHIDVLLTASPKQMVDDYINFLKELNLIPILTAVKSTLVVKGLIKKPKHNNHDDPIIIVDIGAIRTNFIIFNGKSLYFTSSVKIAGNTFDQALAQELKMEHGEARKIKENFGLNKEEKQGQIFDALVPPLTGLTEEINKVLEYYKEHNIHQKEQLTIKKVVLCGGGALLKGISPHLESALNLNVELGNPWINFDNIDLTPKNKLPIIPKEASLAYTAAIGLALLIKDEYY